MNTEQIASLRGMLKLFEQGAYNSAATSHADQISAFVARTACPWSRATLEGHLTASAWALDRTRTNAAMIHHRKLGRWLQPGGHIEAGDASWRAAAQREVTEEIGLTAFLDIPNAEHLFDVDVHAIPARSDVPAHFHYDLRFLFVADVDASMGDPLKLNLDEANDCRWFRLTDLANDAALEPSLRRMVELSIRNLS